MDTEDHPDTPVGWVLADDLPATPWSTVFVDADMDGAVPLYRRPVEASDA